MPSVVSVFGVEPFRIGGTETFARELSLQLGQRGWISVLCFLTEPSPEVRQFLDLPNIKLEVVKDSNDFSLTAGGVARVIRRYRPEILHLHFASFLGTYPWLARLNGTRRIFFTDHASRSMGYVPHRAPFWKRIMVRMIHQPLTKVICVSKYGYACFTALDVLPAERFQLVYNGVDLTRVAPDPRRAAGFRQTYSIPDDRTLVTQVSWMIPEKGIPELLNAARLVLSENQSVQFVLVGDGVYREQYMKDAARMGLGDHITWTGLVSDPFGEGVYDAADIICQLSCWEEVFGWMIAEGMAYGKPVVASRVGGIPELVVDEVSGFLVARGDSETVAKRILALVGDSDLRKKMGRAGSEIAAQRFSLRQNVAELINCYGI
jgi:glycosyltransferase involved in cell wall biosynthesis